MEGMFRQFGIFSQVGQLYQPEDANQLMYYPRRRTARCCRRASTRPARWRRGSPRRRPTAQRPADDPVLHFLLDVRLPAVMDLIWAAGDSRPADSCSRDGRRTTLNGEGLQHEDGHVTCSPRSSPAACPTTRLLLRGRGHHRRRLRRMVAEQEDVFFYLTLMNENYEHPRCPTAPRPGSPGLYLLRESAGRPTGRRAAARERHHLAGVLAGADLLAATTRRRRRVERDQLH